MDKDTKKKQEEFVPIKGCITISLWIALIVFFGQSAWASVYENEIRAGMIYTGFSLLLFFGGIIVIISRKINL